MEQIQTLDEIAIRHGCDKATPWHGYTKVYERLFSQIRNLPLRFLEIGVQFGPSIRTWLDYFPSAHIIGVDVYHDFLFSHPRYTFVQCDCGRADQIRERVIGSGGCPPFSVIIDDGSHYTHDQKTSFETLWPHLERGGIYIIEDWFTSYDDAPLWVQSRPGPAWLSELIASLNWHAKHYHGKCHGTPPPFTLTPLEQEMESIELHRGLIIIHKK